MIRALALILAAVPAHAQIVGRFSPAPLDTFGAVGGWYTEICNNYPAPVTNLAPERVSLAAGKLRLLRPTQAAALMSRKRAKSAKFVLSEIAEYALIGAGIVGGTDLVTMSRHTLGVLAMSTGVAHQLQDKWRSEIPPLPSFGDDLFAGPISLAPGACATRFVYVLKMPASQVVPSAQFTILVPGMPVPSQPASLTPESTGAVSCQAIVGGKCFDSAGKCVINCSD